MSFDVARLSLVHKTLVLGAEGQAAALTGLEVLVDASGTEDIPTALELEAFEPWGQGFPLPVAAIEGRLARPPERFGEAHVRLRLDSVAEPLTWFSGGDRAAGLSKGQHLRVAATPQDHARWGRSWLVADLLESRGNPAP